MNVREERRHKAEEMGSFPPESAGVHKNQTLVDPNDLVNLFKSQQNYLNFFFQNLDRTQTLSFTQTLLNAKGTIFFTGVGKSGFVAQKISQTLTSLGIRSGFLSPVGDITVLSKSDILVIFCKSGNSGEILELVPCMKAKGVFLISVTSMKGNVLEGVSDLNVHLPLERELCPYNLTPVTSSAIQLIFGDTVAIALMGARSLKKDDHRVNHHPTDRIVKNISSKDDGEANEAEGGLSKTGGLNDSDSEDAVGDDSDDDKDDDYEPNEEEGGLSKTGRPNDSDAEDDDDDMDDEIELSPVLAPKQKDVVTEEHTYSSPSKTTAGSARGTPSTSRSLNDKRKSGTDVVKGSNGTPPAKKVKTKNESRSFAKDGSALASKGGSVPKEVQPSAGSVMEDEIRAALIQKSPVTIQDLVAKFKARIKAPKDKGAFGEALKKITKIEKSNGSSFVFLRET